MIAPRFGGALLFGTNLTISRSDDLAIDRIICNLAI